MASSGGCYYVTYISESGRKTYQYRRPRSDTTLAREVLSLRRRARRDGYKSPYGIESHRTTSA